MLNRCRDGNPCVIVHYTHFLLIFFYAATEMCCVHNTDCVVFASRVLYLTLCHINVLHADLLAVVGGGRAGEGQQQHVDDTGVDLTGTGADSGLVMVPNLGENQSMYCMCLQNIGVWMHTS